MMRRILVGVLLAVAVLGAVSARARLVAIDVSGRGSKDLLYLPNGKYLKAISLGHAPLVADFVYLWAIQYYSDYDRSDRYRYVEHVFGNVIAELDPGYIDPYWLGAMILSTEAQDVEAGLRLLDEGFEKNPSAWILPYLAGWECDRVGQFDRAAAYFDRAAKAPGAPPDLVRLKAGMTARTGNLREAIARWQDVLDDPRNDDGARAIATRQIRTLTVRADVHDLDAAVAAYREQHGRLPRSLDELVRAGIVGTLPRDPDGAAYAYDPSTGTVSSTASRMLGS
jgi:tetratricopeptide (TPR) repeat protein